MADPLEGALTAWALAPDPAAAAGVYSALLDAVLLIPVHATVVSEHADTLSGLPAEKEAELAVLTVALAGDRRVLPIFTSAEVMRRWRIEARPVRTPVTEACRAAVDEGWTGLVVDPGRLDFVVGPAAMRALAGGFVPVAGEESMSTGTVPSAELLSAPGAEPSAELLASLRRALAREPAVARAWLLRTVPAVEIGLLLRTALDQAGLATVATRLSARLGEGSLAVAALDPDTAEQAAATCRQLWP